MRLDGLSGKGERKMSMVADYIFRGKEPRMKEWVYGSLIQAKDFCCILEDESKVHPMDWPYLDGEIGIIDGNVTPVDPKTVGQWTFFTDKNGKKIFDGDIVERAHKACKRHGEPDKMFVTWYKGSWILLWHDDEDFLSNWCSEASHHGEDIGGCIVIGNVYDNPEMLKEE
jgi:uncharacterized phage protein (TIGR01671 family)